MEGRFHEGTTKAITTHAVEEDAEGSHAVRTLVRQRNA